MYTERFMGLPTNESNWAGYQASDVSSRVHNFRHKLFYLIHGNADDNVHYQQSMMLSRALELSDILFFQQVCRCRVTTENDVVYDILLSLKMLKYLGG